MQAEAESRRIYRRQAGHLRRAHDAVIDTIRYRSFPAWALIQAALVVLPVVKVFGVILEWRQRAQRHPMLYRGHAQGT